MRFVTFSTWEENYSEVPLKDQSPASPGRLAQAGTASLPSSGERGNAQSCQVRDGADSAAGSLPGGACFSFFFFFFLKRNMSFLQGESISPPALKENSSVFLWNTALSEKPEQTQRCDSVKIERTS